MRAAFADLIGPLEALAFWTAAAKQNRYLPDLGLWAPQRRAVGLSLAYIAAKTTSARAAGAALVKMPTGTGKTGAIATLACAVPRIKRTLVITPRRALVEQMVTDLHARLWGRFNLVYDGQGVRTRRPEDPEKEIAPKFGPIWRLLPSRAAELAALAAEERLVLVGTFAALEQVLRPERPAHRLTGRRPVGPEEVPPDNEAEDDLDENARIALAALLRRFDLVVVDESHYEPAFVWSQCIRSLGVPTVLFSATPYRNDFRYFQIDGRFAFSLGFQEARDKRLIRDVRIISNESDLAKGESFAQRLVRFATAVGPASPELARVIVRAETHDRLIAIRQELATLGERSVLIHHREKRNDAVELRFNDAAQALAAEQTEGVRFWLHQWKLLEGVDDSRFIGVAVADEFTTSRAVVQQFGRVLRYACRDELECALVMGDGILGSELAARFERYLAYEARFDADPGEALCRETRFFEALREAAPPVQYIAGDFRDRLELDECKVGFSDIQLPLRAVVMRRTTSADLNDLAEACRVAMGLEDRHDAVVLGPKEPGDPENVRLVAYVAWRNSPLLTQHAMPTWDLGIMSLVAVGERLFLLDTDRLVVDPEKLGLEPEQPDVMRRLVPVSSDDENCRVTVASAVSLDLSEMGIRSVTARMRDFGTGFFDLAQSMQAATSVRAQLNGTGGPSSRYLSLQRAALSDARGGYLPVAKYADWIADIASRLDSTIEANPAFARFAQGQPAPPTGRAKPLNVLFDFAGLIGEDGGDVPEGWEPVRTQALAHANRCLDVGDDGSFAIDVGGCLFEGKLRYEVTGTLRRRGRYVVDLPELDAHLIGRKAKWAERSVLLSSRLTREQAFRVVPADPALVYAQRHFYRPGVTPNEAAKELPGGPLEAIIASPWLAAVRSEKGDATSPRADWAAQSVFGGVYAHFGLAGHGAPDLSYRDEIGTVDPAFAALLAQFSLVVCDDGGTETCDFLCVDETRRRVVLMHAKVGDTVMSLNGLQEVGRQAQASLAFVTRSGGLANRTKIWATPVPIKNGEIPRRILIPDLKPKAAWRKASEAVHSARYAKEVWIIAGRILKRETLKRRLSLPDPSPAARQMLYYLSSLQTSAARANVAMRIFCSP